MRLTLISAFVASLATVESAHTVNCWGKALHPEKNDLETIIRWTNLRIAIAKEAGTWINKVIQPESCIEVACVKDLAISVRACNSAKHTLRPTLQNVVDTMNVILNECTEEYDGEMVSGGVVDHPDGYSLVVQEDDTCKY
ncbi:hypothetical protein ASPSYDRAFT_134400 [Aspergillus sydowii CBS 593.65]|uniref:Ecp2 effector protein domain-containing protein n=1 Tax=Aspergillus sydowii CBS 593.65 TaxID=1036612 RepID=A0A1L9TAU7_9EURO|nr:uncharacterized protein ASPSYDRAFT_134400 [Aspergillus sydowii CBS 593.65]OJJ56511.1 hypothetical protein ASPSYDRAFT_134400 [Aspergillus sydowii CBS 593.65]